MYTGGDAWGDGYDLNRFLSPCRSSHRCLCGRFIERVLHERPFVAMLVFTAGFAHFGETHLRRSACFCVLRLIAPTTSATFPWLWTYRQIVPTNASIAVEMRRTMPYFMPELRMIDLLGNPTARGQNGHASRIPTGRGNGADFIRNHLNWVSAPVPSRFLSRMSFAQSGKRTTSSRNPSCQNYRKQTLRESWMCISNKNGSCLYCISQKAQFKNNDEPDSFDLAPLPRSALPRHA